MIWNLKDNIKRGYITFQEGDVVVVFRRKSNGYPNRIKDGVEYEVKSVSDDSLFVSNGEYLQTIKVHKTYMIQKSMIRDFKINSILDI